MLPGRGRHFVRVGLQKCYQGRAIFGATCGAWRAVLRDAAVGYSVVDFIFVLSALCGAFFGAWCVVVDQTV